MTQRKRRNVSKPTAVPTTRQAPEMAVQFLKWSSVTRSGVTKFTPRFRISDKTIEALERAGGVVLDDNLRNELDSLVSDRVAFAFGQTWHGRDELHWGPPQSAGQIRQVTRLANELALALEECVIASGGWSEHLTRRAAIDALDAKLQQCPENLPGAEAETRRTAINFADADHPLLMVRQLSKHFSLAVPAEVKAEKISKEYVIEILTLLVNQAPIAPSNGKRPRRIQAFIEGFFARCLAPLDQSGLVHPVTNERPATDIAFKGVSTSAVQEFRGGYMKPAGARREKSREYWLEVTKSMIAQAVQPVRPRPRIPLHAGDPRAVGISPLLCIGPSRPLSPSPWRPNESYLATEGLSALRRLRPLKQGTLGEQHGLDDHVGKPSDTSAHCRSLGTFGLLRSRKLRGENIE